MSCLCPFWVLAIKCTCVNTAEFFFLFYMFVQVCKFNCSVRIWDYLLVLNPCGNCLYGPGVLGCDSLFHFSLLLFFFYAKHFLQGNQFSVISRHVEILVRFKNAVLFLSSFYFFIQSDYNQQILPYF